jgi:tetratricopeptide (TPR) repeat protein
MLFSFIAFIFSAHAREPVAPDRDFDAIYAGREVPVVVSSGGRSSNSYLLGVQGDELELRPADAVNPGERVYIPLNEIQEFVLEYPVPETLRAARATLRQNGPGAEILDRMRPYIWPLVEYLPVPEEQFNIHPLVDAYLGALIQGGQYDEAYAMVLEIPLSRVTPNYVQHTLDLAEALVRIQNNTRALALLGIVPLTEADLELQALLMRYAGQLRSAGNLDEALILYDRIRSLPGNPYERKAILWTAYCNVRLDRVESARLFLAEVGPLESRDPEFSLYQLVLARIGLLDGDYHEAMEQVSQGVVFSRIGYEWIPELLYTNGLCYESLGNPATARSVYDQVILFFPSNPWADRSRERLEVIQSETPSPES